ncbi:MAG: hypothetical protein R6T98_12835 [Desulfatiglandales bacterium]
MDKGKETVLGKALPGKKRIAINRKRIERKYFTDFFMLIIFGAVCVISFIRFFNSSVT